MGRTVVPPEARPFLNFRMAAWTQHPRRICAHDGRLFGTYLHGLFDQAPFRRWWLNRLRTSKDGRDCRRRTGCPSMHALIGLADFVEQHLSVSILDRLLEEAFRMAPRRTGSHLVLVVGGASSGKSEVALQLASKGITNNAPRAFVATGEGLDEEMAMKIARHRQSRSSDWSTAEVPLELTAWFETLRTTLSHDCD